MKTLKPTAKVKPKNPTPRRRKHNKDKERPKQLFRPRMEAVRNGNGTRIH